MACSSNSIIQSSSSSSSSSAVTRSAKNHIYYDVFVSFRGEDTRNGFTDYLFGALNRKGIRAFRDNTMIRKGEFLTPELHRAIEVSQVYIVVFSKNYASSTWCMKELEYILKCAQPSGKRILTVFYDVDPSDVRKQSGDYAEAFVKYEERSKQDLEFQKVVVGWREALTQVGSICGSDMRNKPQYAKIEEIVEEVFKILGFQISSPPTDLIGMDYPIEEFLETHLRLDKADEVRVVGISGMRGIGKTTLARNLYDRISHQFDAHCFINDVSKFFRHDGATGVQKLILHQTLGQEHLQICNFYNAANLIRSRLRRVRVLIFLDNVDREEQLEKLDLNREWLATGSRIVIISNDVHIFKAYVDAVYKVPLLNETNSRRLFSRKAFKLDNIMSSYEEFAYDILNHVNGLPLAIKLLGSFLFGRNISEWRSAVARLRERPSKDIMDVLRLSFDGLEETEKEIFLHIACYFDQQKEEYVKNILNCCGFHADIGLGVLIDKSVLSISEGMVKMHALLRELGRIIAQESFIAEPRKWTRLWDGDFNFSVELMENAEAVCCYGYEEEEEMEISKCEALSRMSHLRLLILLKANFSGRLRCLSNELRYVEWSEYPFKYLPSNFQPNQLVELTLKHSSITKVWEGKKYLPKLRNMDLSYSKCLMKMPHFGEVPNLERLNLEGCVNLMLLDPSIGVLKNLLFLNLKDCKNLRSIPNNIFDLISLKYLNLSGCFKVFNNAWYLNGLDISESGYHFQSTYSIVKWIMLLPFDYFFYSTHGDLLPSLASFSCLRELDIGFCGVRKLPDAIGCVHWLERLNLEGNNFVRVPSLGELSKLVYLNLQHCKHLEYLLELPSPGVIRQDEYYRRGEMYLFNCPKLCERDQSCSMTLSWMIKFIQAHQESSVSFDCVHIVIPGSEKLVRQSERG